MATKIRLARHGKKGHPFYHIVIADSRAPRDGKYIEKLGTYNPNTNPASIELDFDSALAWVQKGAQPTDTAKAILSYKGVMMKKHLLDGVKKGAFTAEVAEQKFQTWIEAKDAKILAKVNSLEGKAKEDATKRLADETKVKEAKAAELAKKAAEEAAAAEPVAVEEVVSEIAETPAEEAAAE